MKSENNTTGLNIFSFSVVEETFRTHKYKLLSRVKPIYNDFSDQHKQYYSSYYKEIFNEEFTIHSSVDYNFVSKNILLNFYVLEKTNYENSRIHLGQTKVITLTTSDGLFKLADFIKRYDEFLTQTFEKFIVLNKEEIY